MSVQVSRWIVDYGLGESKEVRLPHSWRQEVDVRFEGTAVYSTLIDVPHKPSKLRFGGVSYSCEIRIEDKVVKVHEGIWDAFDVSLENYKGRRIRIEVAVTKNGGESYPTRKTLSGKIPFLFQTFGGIFRPVEIIDLEAPLNKIAPKPRYVVSDQKLFCNSKPLMIRAVRHEGWFPEFVHCHPNQETINREVETIKSYGFNTIYFDGWLPPHTMIEQMNTADLHAWISLPLVDPNFEIYGSCDQELEQIIRQYAHHSNIFAWSLGSQLAAAPEEWRKLWTKKIQAITACAFVDDGANFSHSELSPDCSAELVAFPEIAQQILNTEKIICIPNSLGGVELHRDVQQIAETMPFWASGIPELNHPGVRAFNEVSHHIGQNRFAHDSDEKEHQALMLQSVEKAIFFQKKQIETLRSKNNCAGYILDRWRDTPKSSSGILTDWGRQRFQQEQFESWNAENVLVLLPSFNLVKGVSGNKMSRKDSQNLFCKTSQTINIGLSAGSELKGSLIWKILDESENLVAEGVGSPFEINSFTTQKVGEAVFFIERPGKYTLNAEFGAIRNKWPIQLTNIPEFRNIQIYGSDVKTDSRYEGISFRTVNEPKAEVTLVIGWDETILNRVRLGEPMIVILDEIGTLEKPFWRSSIESSTLSYDQIQSVATDRVINPVWLDKIGNSTWLQIQIDTKSYEEYPLIAKIGSTVFTTFIPHGGQGALPNGLRENPAGCDLIEYLLSLCHRKQNVIQRAVARVF